LKATRFSASVRFDDNVGDDPPRLIFIPCHPVLPSEGRIALTLRLLGGNARAISSVVSLVPEPTVAQRIVRSSAASKSGTAISFSANSRPSFSCLRSTRAFHRK